MGEGRAGRGVLGNLSRVGGVTKLRLVVIDIQNIDGHFHRATPFWIGPQFPSDDLKNITYKIHIRAI